MGPDAVGPNAGELEAGKPNAIELDTEELAAVEPDVGLEVLC